MTESANKKGNPYHDEEGKFTTKEGQGHASDTLPTEKIDNIPSKKISLKSGVDLAKLKQEIAAKTNPLENDMVMPQNIQEAELQGNRIIGSKDGVVGYRQDTDVVVAFEFNKALKDITKDFKEILIGDNNNLLIYGTQNKRVLNPSNVINLINNTFADPKYQNQMKTLGVQPTLIESKVKGIILQKITAFYAGFNVPSGDPNCGGSTAILDNTLDNPNQELVVFNAGSSVKFNTETSRSNQKYEDYLKDSPPGHFLPIGNKSVAYMVAVHELGHHVYGKLSSLFDEEDKLEQEKLFTDGLGYKNFEVEKYPEALQPLFGVFRKNDYKKLYQKGEISGYAIFSPHEHMAEAFANVYCMGDGATEHNKKLVLFLKSVYNKHYQPQ